MIRLILLDLDGTLLTSDKQISPANYRALETAAKNGVHIVPATGRVYAGMPQVVRDLPFFRYAVAVNGAQVYDRAEDRVLYRAEIPMEDAERVYDRLETFPVIFDCYMDGWGYMDRRFYERIDEFISDPLVNGMVKHTRRPVEDFRGFLRREGRSLQKIQMFFKDMDERARDWKALIEEFPGMAVTSSIANNVELNAGNANKGAALRFLCEYLGVDVRDSMAFGDGTNDSSMIEAAGVGVAMANADRALLDAADYVTCANDEDGVAAAVARFCPELGL